MMCNKLIVLRRKVTATFRVVEKSIWKISPMDQNQKWEKGELHAGC